MTYENVHFFTLDTNGVRQLRIMKYPEWEKRILNALFDEIKWAQDDEGLDHDLYAEGKAWLSFLTGDLCRLWRFGWVARDMSERCGILCFSHQLDLVRGYLGNRFNIATITLDDAEEILFN